jgi:hypothetical protein
VFGQRGGNDKTDTEDLDNKEEQGIVWQNQAGERAWSGKFPTEKNSTVIGAIRSWRVHPRGNHLPCRKASS